MLLLSALNLAWLAAAATAVQPPLTASDLLRKGSAPSLPIGLYRHLKRAETAAKLRDAQSERHEDAQLRFGGEGRTPRFSPHTFKQRVSHVGNRTDEWPQRYWFDATFYKPGGPVYLLDGGETNGEDRIQFLETGILRILAEATGGLGVVLEHRYYGESFPVQKLDTESLRFLTTEESLYDSAHFAQNVVFPGLEGHNLSAANVPWIYYGGSYAGAKSAFARKLFPEVFWGALASSAVTVAIEEFHDYYTPIMQHGPAECISLLQNHTELIDTLLELKTPFVTSRLKDAFGLGNVTSDADFANALALPLGSWQARNWDPAVGSTRFFQFCDAITANSSSSSAAGFDSRVASLFPSLPSDPRKALESFQGYAAYVRDHVTVLCPPGATQDECFGSDEYGGDDLEEAPWKSWAYQFCTEWGYFMGHPPSPEEPSIVSRLLDVEYASKVCRIAFPPGELNKVPSRPNVTAVNQYGGYNLSYPRLAFIDGSEDPWLYATPHSPLAPHHGHRPDTLSEPFKLIPGGVHHWDENGSRDLRRESEPKAIRKVHEEEIRFVQAWLEEWERSRKWRWEGGEEEEETGRQRRRIELQAF
ncbi:hypothetical protein JCM10908_005082 [Rhodotorula pacifica]|uniref:uncharacterized protein n=1 Tax=Rhodotorula pacifica TaxID=1495444 RepID=UPI00317CAED1